MWLDYGDLGGLLDYACYSWRIVIRFIMELNWPSYFGSPVPNNVQCHDSRLACIVMFNSFLQKNTGLNFWASIRLKYTAEICCALH